ncbi:MAG: hypothetical protein KKD11_01070 [Candidatus Omnitrophica bacterium]|nr:hypothetical protein [Candidatus Omnitrophota bacterium]
MRKRIFIVTFIFMAGLLAFTRIASAAFVASPMEFHIDVASGEENTYTFYVRNRGDETIALKVYTGDFWIQVDGKELFLDPGEVERTCATWLEVAPEELELAPDESRAIRFKIKVPAEKKGTYWGMVFVEQISKPTIKTAKKGDHQFNILSFQRVGVRIFENAPGAEKSEGKINAVNVRWDKENEFFKIGLVFENEGEILLKCKGTIEVKDMTGETVATAELQEFNSYPLAARTREIFIKETLPPGQYTALAVVDYGEEYLVAGETVFEVKGE